MEEEAQPDNEKRFRIFVGYVIVVAWAISFLAGLIIRDYQPPPTIHALMMVVAGALFTDNIWKGISDARNRRGSEEGQPRQDTKAPAEVTDE